MVVISSAEVLVEVIEVTVILTLVLVHTVELVVVPIVTVTVDGTIRSC